MGDVKIHPISGLSGALPVSFVNVQLIFTASGYIGSLVTMVKVMVWLIWKSSMVLNHAHRTCAPACVFRNRDQFDHYCLVYTTQPGCTM